MVSEKITSTTSADKALTIMANNDILLYDLGITPISSYSKESTIRVNNETLYYNSGNGYISYYSSTKEGHFFSLSDNQLYFHFKGLKLHL